MGMLSRLLLFVLVVWLARTILVGLARSFRASPRQGGIKGPSREQPDPQTEKKLDLSKDNVIDVPFTEVDPKR